MFKSDKICIVNVFLLSLVGVLSSLPALGQHHMVTTQLTKCALTLLVEFPDDSVQVGVLERNMTASHRHFGAERKDFSDT